MRHFMRHFGQPISFDELESYAWVKKRKRVDG
jgi:hypothetical protein